VSFGRVVGAGVIGVLVVGCGAGGAKSAVSSPTNSTSPSGATPSATVSVTGFAVQYLDFTKPVNSASDAFNAAVNSLPATASTADIAAAAKPFVTALSTVNSALLAAQWPANALADIKALVTADRALSAAIANTSLAPEAYVAAFNAAGAKTQTTSNTVRADLGLPPSAS
jgi:hypothetical protein